jgi:hypothetical protein
MIQAGVKIVDVDCHNESFNENQNDKQPENIKSKKIVQQKSIQNLKIIKPQMKLPVIKKDLKQLEQQPSLIIEEIKTNRTLSGGGKSSTLSETVSKPKVTKQIVRKNTITQLNHVPFPSRKIIFSIDPGRVNFACRLEERKDDGTIVGLLFIKARFEELLDINRFFEKYDDLLSQTTICIVEKQMSINYTMIRISQHVETYFLTKYPHVAVYEISAKLKVGKEETISTAKRILENGKDETSVDLLEKLGNPEKQAGKRKPKKEKLDDLCDTVCQIEAFMDEMKRLEFKVPQGYILQTKAGGKK